VWLDSGGIEGFANHVWFAVENVVIAFVLGCKNYQSLMIFEGCCYYAESA
jgi:hypothetical protein